MSAPDVTFSNAEADAVGEQPGGLAAPCPVCASPFVARVREVPTIRTHRSLALYACLRCRSFWNPSGYTEGDRQRQGDAKWGLGVADRNREAAGKLFDRLAAAGIVPRAVAEIGCNVGTLLAVARDRGMQTVGYDINRFAIAHAREEHGLEVHAEEWTADTETIPFDLLVCISVLEHLSEPRPLIENLCVAARRRGAALFVSVPFLNEPQWPHLLDADPKVDGTPFFDNDVHVTHFSTAGMITAMEEFGCEGALPFGSWLWQGVLWRPRPNNR